MTSYIWTILIAAGIVGGILLGNGEQVAQAAMDSATGAAAVCMGMLGTYMLWMGVMNVAQEAGLTKKLSGICKRPLSAIFRGVKRDSRAMEMIAMNIAANMLGMGNAATPFGLKAMEQMQADNPSPDTPTHDMCAFLILNTASVQLLPLTVIAVRSAAMSASPAEIALPALISTAVTAAAGLLAAKLCALFSKKSKNKSKKERAK